MTGGIDTVDGGFIRNGQDQFQRVEIFVLTIIDCCSGFFWLPFCHRPFTVEAQPNSADALRSNLYDEKMNSKIQRTDRPHPVDVHVGARLRLRRIYLGFSQARLAKALGLTFQQIQKYERGANRISASKLFELAVLLDVPVGFFFDGAEGTVADLFENQTNRSGARRSMGTASEDQGFMSRKETMQLIGSYYRIDDDSLRKGVLAVVKSLGKTPNN